MSRITVTMLIIGVAVLAAAPARAQLVGLVGPDRVTLLYDGDLETDSGGIEVTPWGSGSAQSVYEETYVGPHVLKVTTHGPYQGIVLKLGNPAELGEFLTSGAGYVDLRVKPAQAPRSVRKVVEAAQQAAAAASAGRAGRGGAGGRGGGGAGARGGGGRGMGGGGGGARGMGGRGGGGGGARGMGARGGGGGGGMGGGGGGARGMGARGGGGGGRGMGMGGRGAEARGGAGGLGARGGQTGVSGRAPTAAEASAKELTVRHVRVVLFTDQGVMVAEGAPVGVMPPDDRGWTPVAVPLSRFKGVEDAKAVRAVGIFTDESDVFYLGQVRLLVDRTPVQVTVSADPLVARTNQVISLAVSLRGGPINPRVAWDFDKGDGIQQQAVGSMVKYLYEEPGDYLVTCTVSDRDGIRSAVTKGIGIKVEGSA